jgi:hypothetical protein
MSNDQYSVGASLCAALGILEGIVEGKVVMLGAEVARVGTGYGARLGTVLGATLVLGADEAKTIGVDDVGEREGTLVGKEEGTSVAGRM